MKTPARIRNTGARQKRYRLAATYERTNLQAAHVILRDRKRYAGLMVQWAESVLRHERLSAAEWRLIA
jgi:hypothetical protein